MLGSEVRAYGHVGHATPRSLWLAQRLSGVLLGPAVVAHVAVLDGWKNPAGQALLLVIVATHGYAAVWRLIASWQLPGIVTVAAYAGALLTAVLGVLSALVVASLL